MPLFNPSAAGAGGGSLTVRRLGGDPTLNDVATLELAGGFTLTNVEGVARVSVPMPIAGQMIDLVADAGITKDGSDLVGTWADQSGHGADASQATAGYKPLWADAVINGHPVVRFDGVDDSLYAICNGTSLVTFSMFWAVKPLNTTQREIVAWANVPGSGVPFMVARRTATGFDFYVNGGYPAQLVVAHATDEVGVYALTHDGSNWRLYKNGTLVGTYTGARNLQANALGFYLGSGFSGPANFELERFLVYSSLLSDTERNAVIDTIKLKLGVA